MVFRLLELPVDFKNPLGVLRIHPHLSISFIKVTFLERRYEHTWFVAMSAEEEGVSECKRSNGPRSDVECCRVRQGRTFMAGGQTVYAVGKAEHLCF